MTHLARQLAKAAFTFVDLLQPTPHGPRCLIYHQVGADSSKQMNVPIEDFVWQVNWLVANRTVVDVDTAISRWYEPDASNLVSIGFDDGFRDLYEVAFPIIGDLCLPFTLFAATSIIGTETWAERGTPLQWSHVEAMSESGLMTVGAHTHSHIDLRSVTPERIEWEIEKSDEVLLKRLGNLPRHFAYPWGYWSKEADQLVKKRYDAAFLGAPVVRRPHTVDPHRIPRFPVQRSDGRLWFRARVRGGLLLEERVRRRLRGYEGP